MATFYFGRGRTLPKKEPEKGLERLADITTDD